MEQPQRKFLGPVIRKAAQDILNYQAQQHARPVPGSRRCQCKCDCERSISANKSLCFSCAMHKFSTQERHASVS